MQTKLAEQLAQIKYLEALNLPKLDKSVERLINKYADLMTEYHIDESKLLPFVERSSQELSMEGINHADGTRNSQQPEKPPLLL